MKFQHCSNCGEETQDLEGTGLLFPTLCPECFHNKMMSSQDETIAVSTGVDKKKKASKIN